MSIPNTTSFFLFAIGILGTLFFIPDNFVNRFLTGPLLWVTIFAGVGLLYSIIFSSNKCLRLPSKSLILVFIVWATYRLIQNEFDIATVITMLSTFLIFTFVYNVWCDYNLTNEVFIALVLLSVLLSFNALGQTLGIAPIFNSYNPITGPFDNAAGISASLALLYPFSLYFVGHKRLVLNSLGVVSVFLIGVVILMSSARTGMLSLLIITTIYLLHFNSRKWQMKLTVPFYFLFGILSLFLLLSLYYFKKDSADGRLLIWNGSIQIIKKNSLFGSGQHSFTSNYMLEQANFFSENKDSKYSLVADNVNRPFNEYLHEIIRYGFVGFFLLGGMIFYILYRSRNVVTKEKLTVQLSLLSIGISAFFSYPMEYPFIYLMVITLFAYTARFIDNGVLFSLGLINRLTWSLCILVVLTAAMYKSYQEYLWNEIARRSLKGETKEVLPYYEELFNHSVLKEDGLFLYNYGAELRVIGDFKGSNDMLFLCMRYLNDFNVQMLIGANYESVNDFEAAEKHYKLAHCMVPSKFIPLYSLVDIYKKSGKEKEAYKLHRK